jgi:uncharacterized protein YdhG (YjbR/CyaY superfamily)
MSAREIDDYLEGLEPAKRDALQALRVRILNRIPDPATAHLLDGYDWDKGTLRFPVDRVLSDELIDVLIATRRCQTQS